MADIYNQSFWDEDEAELWEELSAIILAAYLLGTTGGISLLPASAQQLVDFDLINQAAMNFVKSYRFDMIKGITDTSRKQTQKIMADWIASGSSLDTLESSLETVFGEARAGRIASTETTRAFAQGNMEAWESTGFVDEAIWMTSEDDLVCPVCEERDGAVLGIGDIDSAPPNGSHVGCRCWLKPVVSEAAVDRRLDEIFA